jgi:hypothetical protein
MVADLLIQGATPEPRFRLETKKTVQDRSVF